MLAANFRGAQGELRGLGRLPQPAAREPPHHDVAVRALQLDESRQQFVFLSRAKRRGLAVNQDCPEREAWRHVCSLRSLALIVVDQWLPSRLIFSTSVVRLIFRSLAA